MFKAIPRIARQWFLSSVDGLEFLSAPGRNRNARWYHVSSPRINAGINQKGFQHGYRSNEHD